MKTLKRTLALVLVLCMVLGVLAVSAGAAYKDADKITYKTAVDVMTGMGIIEGDGGNFDPTAILTREQGAKMLIYTLVTPAIAKILPNSATNYSDVAAGRWSAGVINRATTLKIIEGIGDGKFAPAGTLTGVQFAKMILCALNVPGDFTGNDWDVNSMIASEKIGLTAGITGFNYSAGVSREVACQMLFNAINYSVTGGSSKYVVEDVGNNVIYSGTDAITALLMFQAAGDEIRIDTIANGSIGFDMYGLTSGETTDAFGRVSLEYTNGKTGTAKVIYGTVASASKLTYTKATTLGTIAGALGAGATSSNITLNIIYNGFDKTDATAANGGAAAGSADSYAGLYTNILKGVTTAIGGQGTLIEVYPTATANRYNVIVIETFAKALVAADITAAKAATASADAVKAHITLETKEFETSDFKAGEVVLYTKATTDGATASKIVNVIKANFVTGTVSAVAAGSYFRVDGTQYYLAKTNSAVLASTDAGTTALYWLGEGGTYYLDTYGNVILATTGTPVSVVKNYVYVIDIKEKAASVTGGSDLFGSGGTTTAAQAQAKVIDTKTGVVKVIDLKVVKNTAGDYVYANVYGAATTYPVDTLAIEYAKNMVYEYAEMADGSYALDGITGITAVGVSVAKNTAAIGVANVYATSSTVLTVVEYNSTKTAASVTTYTGIANFPTTNFGAYGYVSADTTGAVSKILIVKPAAAVSAENYAIYKGVGENTGDGQLYAFYVNGAIVNYVDADGNDTQGTPAAFVANTVYNITLTNNEITTALPVAELASGKVIKAIDTTFIVFEDNTIVYFATGYSVFDKTVNYAVGTLSAGMTVSYYGANANAVSMFIITG